MYFQRRENISQNKVSAARRETSNVILLCGRAVLAAKEEVDNPNDQCAHPTDPEEDTQ
jgi:hypothetical protein